MLSCGFISGLVLVFIGLVAFKVIRRLAWCRHHGGGCGGGHGWQRFHGHGGHCGHGHGSYDGCHGHDEPQLDDDGHPYRGEAFAPGTEDDVFTRRGRRGWQRGAAYVAWRLGATPEQRATIERSARELHDAMNEHKPELKKSRSDVADALRDADFDADRMGELFARHDVALESMRKAFVGALAQVHDALDPDQRAKLARIITRGR